MTDEIESHAEFEMALTKLLQQAEKGGLNRGLLAGVLLDYRDHIKIRGEIPGHSDD